MAPVKDPFIGSTTFLSKTSRIQPIDKTNSLFSRGTSTLHRRSASSGTIGIAVGLTILSIIIIGGLFYCAWENTRAEKRRLMKEKEKKYRHRHETHIRGGRRRHSKKHHHVHNHGEHHDYFTNLYIPEQHDEKHHHKCKAHQHRHCRHKHTHDRHERKLWKRQHRCRHKNDNPIIIDDWAPQRPEPILQSPIAFVPKYDGLLMNEMDAPQIGRDFQMGDCFPQCVKGVDGIVCPRHGVVRDDRK